MAENKNFHLRIVTPNRVFYESDAYMLEFTGSEGDMGVYAKHVPTTVVLEPGVMRITDDQGKVLEAAVHSGFVEILQDQITVMAEIAEWPDEIDVARAHEAEVRAQRRLSSGDVNVNLSRAQIALRKALVRQELSRDKK